MPVFFGPHGLTEAAIALKYPVKLGFEGSIKINQSDDK